jgi:hypothetical protein
MFSPRTKKKLIFCLKFLLGLHCDWLKYWNIYPNSVRCSNNINWKRTQRIHGHTVFMSLLYKETLPNAKAKYDFSCSPTPPLSLHGTHMFSPGPVHVGFGVKKLAVTLVFRLVLQVHPVILSPSIDRTHSHSLVTLSEEGGTRWRSWLRQSAKSQKVADSIHNGVVDLKLPAGP